MERSSLPVAIMTLEKWHKDGETLRCSLPFQRKVGVWNSQTKSNLIWSILSNNYIPPIVLIKYDNGKSDKGKKQSYYEIEDGLQRLSSVFSFMEDGFKLHSTTSPVDVDDETYDIAGLKYSDLPSELKDKIRTYHFTIQALENCTQDEAERLFYNINSGVALSTIQKAKPKLGTRLVSLLNAILSADFFTQYTNLTEAQVRREDDLLMLLQGFMLLESEYFEYEYKNLSASSCLHYAEYLKENYSDGQVEKWAEIIDYLSEAFQEQKKYLKKNNVSIIISVADTAMQEDMNADDFGAFCDDFFNNTPVEYKEASGSGNIKKANVLKRLEVLTAAYRNYADNLEKSSSNDINTEEDETSEE